MVGAVDLILDGFGMAEKMKRFQRVDLGKAAFSRAVSL
jgi:hypothetical protein